DWDDLFVAFCPFASRVPYETWVLPVNHCYAFEEDLVNWDVQLRFARSFKSILRRVTSIAPAYHLILHTCPNINAKYERIGNWQTVVEDYHWHFEIMPVIDSKSKSYSLKEVYYNSLAPETAVKYPVRAYGQHHNRGFWPWSMVISRANGSLRTAINSENYPRACLRKSPMDRPCW